MVIIRDFDLPSLSQELLNVIKAVLKPKGRLLYYVTSDVDVTELQQQLPEFRLLAENNYGGAGTKFFLNQYHAYHQRNASRAFMQHRTIINTVKLLLSPVLLGLYPIISATTLVWNFLLKKNKSWAVKKLEFLCLKKEDMDVLSSPRVKQSSKKDKLVREHKGRVISSVN